jgi:preprotein translocase subunit SecA
MNLKMLIFGTSDERKVYKLQKLTNQVTAHEENMRSLNDRDFPLWTEQLKQRLASGENPGDIRIEAFALAREAARRVLGERPFDVQVMGAFVLDEGNIAEMKTGEGKTLVCVLPAYFNSLYGKGVHIVTVNEYLAHRDAEWMTPVYTLLGVSCGVVLAQMDPVARTQAYKCDITYGTNSEFAFDYLRDNMQLSENGIVQRGFNYAIIDEADSILIDEARTPLIISNEGDDDSSVCRAADTIARKLREVEKKPGTNDYPDELLDEKIYGDFTLDRNHHKASLTKDGILHAEKLLNEEGTINGCLDTKENFPLLHYIIESIRARYLYQKDKDYIVNNGEVLIVDEFTGRVLNGRRYSEGLHEAIEAKEQVNIRKQTRTFARISYQNFFCMYAKIAGMTGTAYSEADELKTIYDMDVIAIPTNRQMIRNDLPDRVFNTINEKWLAVCDEIENSHRTFQPVLIGTGSIESSEYLASMLKTRKIPCQILNAKNNAYEASIIAQAGKPGAVTIATNMAGRGTDIKLGGNPESYQGAYEAVRKAGGLYIIGTERFESNRIDNQLRGRAGRQGDPGKSRFFISREDELFSRFPGKRTISASAAQKEIERINFDIRKKQLEFDTVLNEQRCIFYEYRSGILLSDYQPELKMPLLHAADDAWADHLESLDALQDAVYLRAYAQKNPVVEFKIDACRIFEEMLDGLEQTTEELRKDIELMQISVIPHTGTERYTE